MLNSDTEIDILIKKVDLAIQAESKILVLRLTNKLHDLLEWNYDYIENAFFFEDVDKTKGSMFNRSFLRCPEWYLENSLLITFFYLILSSRYYDQAIKIFAQHSIAKKHKNEFIEFFKIETMRFR